ncbi:MAG: TadE family protein [Pirellulales bacterium]
MSEVPSNTQPGRQRLLRRRNRRENRYGVAAVEFAVIAPIFFLMVVGILEFGRALMVQQVIVSAARVGARQAITLNATTAGVTTTVTDYAGNAAVPGVSVVVNPSPNSAAAGDIITVTTTVNFDQVSWLPTPWFLGGNTLTSASSMRKEGLN